jgi:hypothetical protein
MIFSRWFRRIRRPTPPTRPARPGQAFRPAVHILEDRTVPSGFRGFGGFGFGGPGGFFFGSPSFPTSGPATHLQVIAPENVQAGQSFDVVVEALDASNHLATGYTGTVQFSLGTADSGATLPGSYTFTAADHGIHVFDVTLSATGSQTITATDTATSSITGSATTTVNPAPAATHFLVITPESASVGVPTPVTVVALDAAGHLVPNYTGTVHFTSSDTGAALPGDYTFTASDHGRHTFTLTFETAGTQTITATDTATGSITGQGSVTVDTPGAVTHLGVFTLGRALAGSPTQVLVVALDASNNVVPGYTGTVHLTSSDSGATLPADYTFTAADNGSHLFTVSFATPGVQTVTAADTANSSISGRAIEYVLSQLMLQSPWFGGGHGWGRTWPGGF